MTFEEKLEALERFMPDDAWIRINILNGSGEIELYDDGCPVYIEAMDEMKTMAERLDCAIEAIKEIWEVDVVAGYRKGRT